MWSMAGPRCRWRFNRTIAGGSIGAAYGWQWRIGGSMPNTATIGQPVGASAGSSSIGHSTHAWRLCECNCQMALSLKSWPRHQFADKSLVRRRWPRQMYGKCIPLWLQITTAIRTEFLYLGFLAQSPRTIRAEFNGGCNGTVEWQLKSRITAITGPTDTGRTPRIDRNLAVLQSFNGWNQ